MLKEKDCLNDLDYLHSKVKAIHPCIDFKIPLQEIENEMEICRKLATRCKDPDSFAAIVSRFLKKIGDAHTSLMEFQEDARATLPFSTELVDGQVVVDKLRRELFNEEAPGLQRGSVVLYVNGKSAEEIVEENLQRTPFNSIAWGRKKAARELVGYCFFDDSTIEITYADRHGRVRSSHFPLYSSAVPAVRDCLIRENRTTYATPLETEILDDAKAGYFKLRSCWDKVIYNTMINDIFSIDPESLRDIEETWWRLFEEMEKRHFKNLVIDLRGNPGGDSRIGQFLYKYLTKKELSTYRTRVKVSEELKNREEFFSNQTDGAVLEYEKRRLLFPYENRLEESQLKELRQYEGIVVVLIGPDTYSSAEWTAAELQANDLAVFVGEATGGGGSVPGDQLYIQLPRSELIVAVSCKFFEAPGAKLEGFDAVIPDFLCTPLIADFAEGADTVLDYTKRLLQEGIL